tara:strand:+ start:142 stop:843 length:702 start_codon:yes stop_codon:yes gene_type:complete
LDNYNYPGDELRLFADAINWKTYWAKFVSKHIAGDVLEVGAGLGGTYNLVHNEKVSSWTWLEPDVLMHSQLVTKMNRDNQNITRCINGTIQDIDSEKYDCIIYIDVLEHIEKDKQEVQNCISLLSKNGKIIILSPAHNILYSRFDQNIGHCRRYNRDLLSALQSKNLILSEVKYLDSVGLFLNLANRLFLKKSLPSKKQILFWDKIIVPISKVLDPILGFKFGKSILGIYEFS